MGQALVIPTGAQRSGGTCGLPLPKPLLRVIMTLPFVISTGAERSGEICGSAIPSWKCFSSAGAFSKLKTCLICR
jgi:hypothetical protein